jgi:hypothetical protein
LRLDAVQTRLNVAAMRIIVIALKADESETHRQTRPPHA